MHATLKLQCRRVTGNKKSTIGGLIYDSSFQGWIQTFVKEGQNEVVVFAGGITCSM